MSIHAGRSHGRLIVFSAPSGTGKSTIAARILERFPDLVFSVSATTRARRSNEVDGTDYHFLSSEAFLSKVAQGGFIEHEFFFGNYYGTLLDKTSEALDAGVTMLLDLDVKGAVNVKKLFPENTLTIFIKPPGFDVLTSRLKTRESEDAEGLAKRLDRYTLEMAYAPRFDAVVLNDDLGIAVDEVARLIGDFLQKK